MHDVPKRLADGAGDRLQLSEVESPLNQGLITFFRERVTTSLDAGAFRVAFSSDSGSPMPNLVLDLLGDQDVDFVETSRRAAVHLHASQTGVNPPSLLILMQSSLAGARSLAVLKLEREMGVRARPLTQDGKATFDIEQIQDLMLTERTRVFKVGLFVQEGDKLESIRGDVIDKQRGFGRETGVAGYFLKAFLGCELYEAPEVATKRFFEATQTFINDSITDSETKARYQIALIATLSNQDRAVRPRAFADEHLDLDNRRAFLDILREQNVPVGEFEKDTARVAGQLKRVQFDFESGLVVLATTQVLDNGDLITITDLGDRRTRLLIEDNLKRLRGR